MFLILLGQGKNIAQFTRIKLEKCEPQHTYSQHDHVPAFVKFKMAEQTAIVFQQKSPSVQ